MEIDVTKFFESCAPMDFSASALEIGQDAGRITWQAALEESCDTVLLGTDEEVDAFRNFISDFGAWSDEEIDSWTDHELNALCIQFVAGEMREPRGFDLGKDTTDEEWEEYERQVEEGLVSGRLFRFGNRVFFYIGE